MKNVKAIILAGLLGCSAVLTACSSQEVQPPAGGTTDTTGAITATGKVYEGGLHQIRYTQTADEMVKNGVSEYKIMISATANEIVRYAAEELQELFEEATSVKLPIVLDNTITLFTPQTKMIFVGNTAYSDDAGIEVTEKMEDYGYLIKTVGKSIFIEGKSAYASLWGVYGFLEVEFNFDCFSDRMYYIDEVSEVYLKKYDIVDVPDMPVRTNSSGYLTGDALRRMRYMEEAELVLGPVGSHTTFEYIDPEIYNNPAMEATYHPDWFATNGEQLCFLARGNAEELELLYETVLETMIGYIIETPRDSFIFSFSMEDTNNWCSCKECKESTNKYNGSCASTILKFNNELAKRLKAWMQTEAGRPYQADFKISYIAYNRCLPAPATYDAKTDKYLPVDESVVCHENTTVVFAPADMDFQHSIYAECNKTILASFRAWSAISSSFSIYDYGINYSHYCLHYDTFEGMQDFYQLAAESGAYKYFTLMAGKTEGCSAWHSLKVYLSSKLSWDVNVDLNALTEKFFKYYFGDGAEEVYEVFKGVRVLSRKNIPLICRPQSFYGDLTRAELWPKDLLTQWLQLFEKALDKISYLKKVEPEKYQMLYQNIVCERVSFAYLTVQLHEKSFASDYIQKLKLQTRSDCEINQITMFSEYPFKYASDVWTDWGII